MPDVRYGTPAGFAAVAAEAHRRRTSAAGAAAVAVAAVVAFGGLGGLAGRTGAVDRVVPAAPTVSPSPTAVARAAVPDASATPAPGAVAAASPGVLGRPDRPGVASPSAGPAAADPQARHVPGSTPVKRKEWRHGPLGTSCLTRNAGVAECAYGSAQNDSPRRTTLNVWYCAGQAPKTLGFEEDVEVEFRVTTKDDRRLLWTSLRDYPRRPALHAISVGPTECVSWHVKWHRVTSDGAYVTPGNYRLHLVVRSGDATAVIEPVPLGLS